MPVRGRAAAQVAAYVRWGFDYAEKLEDAIPCDINLLRVCGFCRQVLRIYRMA